MFLQPGEWMAFRKLVSNVLSDRDVLRDLGE